MCADLTVKRVIIGILAMLVVLPAFEVTSGVYGEMTSLATGGLKMLHNMAVLAPGSTSSQEFASALQVSSLCFDTSRGLERSWA